MATIRLMPTADSVQKVLSGLFNRTVLVKRTSPGTYLPKGPSAVAVYHRDDGTIGAAWACDLTLAGYAAAALTLIPPDIVAKNIESAHFTQDMVDNLSEVLNIGASVFNLADAPHMALQAVHMNAVKMTPEMLTLLTKPKMRQDVEVSISGYGTGKMALMMP